MFEKEAEEYLKKDGTKTEQILSLMQGKIKVKINQIPFIMAAFQQTYIDGAEFGYNKANEWHYVKDGKYPTHSYRVLVFTDEGVGFGIYGLDDKKWHTYDTGFEVIAWKEVVPPRE